MTLEVRGGHATWSIRLGRGPRRGVLIHCNLGRAEMWTLLGERLGDLATFRAFDLPGHGQSADWTPDLGDIQDMAVRMGASFLDPDRPSDLIGHSYGATIALRLAVENPGAVRSLVLIEPVQMALAAADAPDLLAQNEAQSQGFYDALARGDMLAAAREFTDAWGVGRPWDDLSVRAQEALAARIHFIDATRPSLYHDRPGILAPGRLDRVTCPVLLMSGAESFPVMAAINQALARRLPDATCLEIPGAGHMVPLTHPGAVEAQIRAFWARES